MIEHLSGQELRIAEAIRNSLTPELLPAGFDPPPWVGPFAGYCYTASEAFWYMTGKVYIPNQCRPRGLTSHWFLRDKQAGRVIDLTAEQFPFPVEYDEGVGRGFRTRFPSIRASVVIERAERLLGVRLQTGL